MLTRRLITQALSEIPRGAEKSFCAEKILPMKLKDSANAAQVRFRRLPPWVTEGLLSAKFLTPCRFLYMENPSREQLEHMDLFLVSEIKRPKDGSMEIKFFDRLKALEKLTDDSEKEDRATPFYDAIAKGAEALRSETDES